MKRIHFLKNIVEYLFVVIIVNIQRHYHKILGERKY